MCCSCASVVRRDGRWVTARVIDGVRITHVCMDSCLKISHILKPGVFNLLGHAPPQVCLISLAPPPQKKIFFFCSFWLTLFTQEMHGSVILMYIWYLLYCLRSLETTDCAYEDTPQDSHWYTPAVRGCSHVAPKNAWKTLDASLSPSFQSAL